MTGTPISPHISIGSVYDPRSSDESTTEIGAICTRPDLSRVHIAENVSSDVQVPAVVPQDTREMSLYRSAQCARMGDPDRIQECPECGSGDKERLYKGKPQPGGFYMYQYECNDCGEEWTT